MDRLIDEIVKVSVRAAAATATATSVNTAAVLGKCTKDGVATSVQYGQADVESYYDVAGVQRILELAPAKGTAGVGTITIKQGTATVATASTTANSTVESVVSALKNSWNFDGFTARATASKLIVTKTEEGADNTTFTVEYSDDCGFSGNFSVKAAGSDGNYSDLAKVTRSFFLENATPGRLVCIPAAADPTAATIEGILDDALNMGKDGNNREIDFYHVIVRMGEDATAANVVALIAKLEDWCKTNFKLAHIELQSRTVASDVMANLESVPTRVAVYFHSETSGKSYAAALVADRCGNDPARGTWAHKTLGSIVADATSKNNLVDAQDSGLNIYASVAGISRSFFGTVGTKTAFIDEVVKKDWLKFRTQEAIYNLLGSANNGDGVDYNDAGIAAVGAAINGIFTTAADSEHRYVMPDSYEVIVPKYENIPAEDRAVRNLPDIRVPFSIQASIHTVKTVELQVVA